MAIIRDVELKTKKGRLVYRLIFVILVIGAFVQFFPLFWMILGTFKTDKELISAIPTLFPKRWSLAAYKNAFEAYDIWRNIGNTLVLCSVTIVLQISNSALSAYSLSKMRPRFGKQILLIILGTMMFSGAALMFPLYIMMADLGLLGSKWALILSSGAWAYTIFLFKNFFDNIPTDLMEAARIDGASNMRTFFSIVLPLSKAVFAVNILNSFMALYNDFLYPLMLLPDEKNWTIMIRIYNLDMVGRVQPTSMYVLLVTAVMPILLVYLLAQRNIAEGISTTGIKG